MTRRASVNRSAESGQLSHDVRIWKIRTYAGKKRKSYIVRWTVAGQQHGDTFASYALADAFRAKLIGHQQKGTPFDITAGLPESMLREGHQERCYDLLIAYADMKWKESSANNRRSVADTLKTVSPALIRMDRSPPNRADIWKAVYTWVVQPKVREEAQGEPPADIGATVAWLERNTIPVTELEHRIRGPILVRAALDAIGRTKDGATVKPNTYNRRRAVLYNMFEYWVELGVLSVNPLSLVKVKARKAAGKLDRRAVANHEQYRQMLDACWEHSPTGQRLTLFFALMGYAALRPAEALGFREAYFTSLPEDGSWGEIALPTSFPRAGRAWTDSGESREERGLKHRAEDEVRYAPAHPELVAIARRHIREFRSAPDGRLIVGVLGGMIEEKRYLEIWQAMREAVFTPAQVASPLARRPYDQRHMAVSLWLKAGVSPTQVAEWAGQSVEVLFRFYASCIVGHEAEDHSRIERATGRAAKLPAPSPQNGPEELPDQR
jgi:integrase